jgi:hypothetical protein
MTSMKKILLAGAGAALLAFSAAPVLAAGPMIPSKSDTAVSVEKAEYRWDRWRGRWVWHDPPRPFYYGPRYGRDYWFDRDDNPPGPRGGPGTNWENPPGPRGGPGASPDRRYPSYWYERRTY